MIKLGFFEEFDQLVVDTPNHHNKEPFALIPAP
jgi:hypothetical protein